MPISKREFQKGRIVYPIEDTIRAILRKNPDKAFTVKEVAEGVGYVLGQSFLDDFTILMGVQAFLDRFVGEEKVSKRHIDFQDYYITAE